MSGRNSRGILWAAVVIALLTTPMTGLAVQSEATPVISDQPSDTDSEVISSDVPDIQQPAADFCLMQDGILAERFPFAGIDTTEPLRLQGSAWFCEFTGSPDAEPPTSRISISIDSLYASDPTLATLAYLAKVPVPESNTSAGLAIEYCAYLGGSSRFGIGEGAAGGWASDVSDPETTSIGICVFADGSAIDDWGLTYNANDIVRGADLSDLMRYQGTDLPSVAFPTD